MKRCTTTLSAVSLLVACGCGSIVNSVREAPEKTGTTLTGSAYYLPRGRVLVAGTWNKDTRFWDIKVTPVVEADPEARYVAKRHVNGLFDDDITISVDPTTGLLQTANATSTDQTVNAMSALVSAAASALTFGAGLGPVSAAGGPAAAADFADVKAKAVQTWFQVSLEPTLAGGSKTVYLASTDAAPATLYAKVALSLTGLDPDYARAPDGTAAPANGSWPGIMVRRAVPFALNIKVSLYHPEADGTSPFSVGDIKYLTPMATTLTTPARPIDTWVQSRLSAATRAKLSAFLAPGAEEAGVKAALVEDLNRIRDGTSIYTPAQFAGVTLRAQTDTLRAQVPHEGDLQRLNRLLLEDAYPSQLSRNAAVTIGALESPPQTVMLPDQKHDYCLTLARTPLVTTTTKISLANGIPQSQQQVRPSIVMGIVGIPKTLLGALAPIPLQVRTDQMNLVTTQDKILTAQQDINKLNKP